MDDMLGKRVVLASCLVVVGPILPGARTWKRPPRWSGRPVSRFVRDALTRIHRRGPVVLVKRGTNGERNRGRALILMDEGRYQMCQGREGDF